MKWLPFLILTALPLLSCVNEVDSLDSNVISPKPSTPSSAQDSESVFSNRINSISANTLAYPKADVLVTELACSCYSDLAKYSVDMQNWAADNFEEIMAAEEEVTNQSVKILREKEEEYFLKLQEARNCYEDSLSAFGEFYMKGAPGLPTLMLEYCPEIYNILMLNGGMARQALYGQEPSGEIPSESLEK